jgi:hypothetical protein
VWRVTAAVLLAGLLVLAFAFTNAEWSRRRTLRKLAVGADASRVTQLLGTPADSCPAGSLDHLRARFPPGTPPAVVEQVISRLQRETGSRWVYPLKAGGRAGCVPASRSTEVGLDRRRRVLWYVPVTGRVPVVVPDGYLPQATGT